MSRPDLQREYLCDEGVDVGDPERILRRTAAILALQTRSLAAPLAPADPTTTTSLEPVEARLDWPLVEAGDRADRTASELDAARRWLQVHAAIVVASIALQAWRTLGPGGVTGSIGFAALLLLGARIAIVSQLSSAARACAATTTGLPGRGTDVAVAFFLPFYNFVMPFRILRRLADASTNLDLPRVKEQRIVVGTGTYRTTERMVTVDTTPAAPSSPLLVTWQMLFVSTFIVRSGPLSFALMVASFAAETFVLHRVLARFRIRVAHLRAIASTLAR